MSEAVKVAIIDSGVNPAHPHVAGVAGGVRITALGEDETYLDFIGHGTAVAGAIREKAPAAELYAVKVFEQSLTTNIDRILRALEWCRANKMQIVNLSLGTLNLQHQEKFTRFLAEAEDLLVVAAREINGQPSLPGCLPGVVSVGLDWACPREAYRWNAEQQAFYASGYARPIPGVPLEQNLKGISFAVANMTGFVARACESQRSLSRQQLQQKLQHACLPAAQEAFALSDEAMHNDGGSVG